jgi:lipopolysaccharide/colanic/teichoic acid biosynthesis glycosyltransferase
VSGLGATERTVEGEVVIDLPPAPVVALPSPPAESSSTSTGPDSPSVEVVVLTQNSEATLARSLGAILEAAAGVNAPVLFIDLGSTDGTRSLAARLAPGSRGVWLTAEDDLVEALRVAAAVSRAEMLVVIKPTVRPSSAGDIARLVSHLVAHPYAAIAAPALRAHDDTLLSTTHPEPEMTRFSRAEWVMADAIVARRTELPLLRPSRRRSSGWLQELDVCLQLRRRGREVHYVRSVEWLDAGGRATARIRPHRPSWPMVLPLLRHPRYAARLLSRTPPVSRALSAISRTLDILVSLVAIVLLSPVLLALALAVRIDSRGPALFRQRRLGRHARSFHMYKFRTMHDGADSSLHRDHVRDMIVNRLCADGSVTRQVYKVHPDPRVTRVGRVLRRCSLDELPQLFNILRGDMTLVGFRPPIPYEVVEYPDWYFRRFDGKPGLTGLWQVSGRNERSYEDMVRLDIEYFNRRSWLVDLKVLVRTIAAVITGRGAY